MAINTFMTYYNDRINHVFIQMLPLTTPPPPPTPRPHATRIYCSPFEARPAGAIYDEDKILLMNKIIN